MKPGLPMGGPASLCSGTTWPLPSESPPGLHAVLFVGLASVRAVARVGLLVLRPERGGVAFRLGT